MLEKFGLALKSPRAWPWRLALKAALYGVLVSQAPEAWVFGVLAALWLFFLYFSGLQQGRPWPSFLALFIVSMTLHSYGVVLGALILFFLLSARELAFVRYDVLYGVSHSGLIFLLTVSVAALVRGPFATSVFLSAAALLFFLMREMLDWAGRDAAEGFRVPIRKNLLALGAALLLLEVLWVVTRLPLSSFHTAALILFTTLSVEEFLVRSLRGTLSRVVLLRNATVMVLASLAIFAITPWEP